MQKTSIFRYFDNVFNTRIVSASFETHIHRLISSSKNLVTLKRILIRLYFSPLISFTFELHFLCHIFKEKNTLQGKVVCTSLGSLRLLKSTFFKKIKWAYKIFMTKNNASLILMYENWGINPTFISQVCLCTYTHVHTNTRWRGGGGTPPPKGALDFSK